MPVFLGYFSQKPCLAKNVNAVLLALSSPNQPLVHFCFIPATEMDLVNTVHVRPANGSPPPSAVPTLEPAIGQHNAVC